MYIPPHFREAETAKLLDLVAAYSFGTLVVATGDAPEIAHLPFLVEREADGGVRLSCHVARANPVWRAAEEAGRGVAVFTGPDAYVSPDWYVADGHVPTWNFVAVHASGSLRLLSEAGTRTHIVDLAARHEAAFAPKAPWTLDALSGDRAAAMRGAIVGIVLDVDELHGKFKLSQNRSPDDRAGVARELRARGGENGRAIAELMDGIGEET